MLTGKYGNIGVCLSSEIARHDTRSFILFQLIIKLNIIQITITNIRKMGLGNG